MSILKTTGTTFVLGSLKNSTYQKREESEETLLMQSTDIKLPKESPKGKTQNKKPEEGLFWGRPILGKAFRVYEDLLGPVRA